MCGRFCMVVACVAVCLVCVCLWCVFLPGREVASLPEGKNRSTDVKQKPGNTDEDTKGRREAPLAAGIIGKVVDETGRQFKLPAREYFSPLKVSLLQVVEGARRLVDQRKTADGFFAFDEVAPGDYCAEVSSAAYHIDGESCFRIAPNEKEVAVTVVLGREPRYRIAGRVFIDDVLAANRTIVMKISYDNGWKAALDLETDAGGAFSRPTFGDESFSAVISCDGALPVTERFETVPGIYNAERDLHLRSSAVWQGILTDPKGAPVSYAELVFTPAGLGEKGRELAQRTYTRDDGSFRLSGVGFGTYRVEVGRMGWAEGHMELFDEHRALGEVVLDKKSQGLQLQADMGKTVLIEMQIPGGEMTGSNGLFLDVRRGSGAEKWLRKRAGMSLGRFCSEVAEHFQDDLGPRAFSIVVGKLFVSWLPADADIARAIWIRWGVGACAGEAPFGEGTDAIIRLSLTMGMKFKFKTEDWAGAAVPGAGVSYRNAFGEGAPDSGIGVSGGFPPPPNAWCRTDEGGEGQLVVYSLPGLELHSEIVCAFPDGGEVRLRNPEAYVKYCPVIMRPSIPNAILGCVIDAADGTALRGAVVSADREGGGEILADMDADAWFRLSLDAGLAEARLRVTKEGYQSREFAAGKGEIHLVPLDR